MNLKEQILKSNDTPKPAPIDVPEWGGTFYIRVMSGAERDAFEQAVIVGGSVDMDNISAKLLVRTLADDNGNRIFTDADADELGKKSALVLRRLYPIAQSLNGLSKEDVGELVKNSESARSAVS